MSILDLAHALLEHSQSSKKIDDILNRSDVKEEIEKPREINRDHDIPYLAGSSKNGGTTYIDKRVPKEIEHGTGKFDPAKYLNIHEQTEHSLMSIGKLTYEKAHAIATDKEKEAVEKDGHNWKKYEETMDGYIDETEHEKLKSPPKDLYLKPYPHNKQELLKKAAEKHEEPVKEHHVVVMALLHPGNK